MIVSLWFSSTFESRLPAKQKPSNQRGSEYVVQTCTRSKPHRAILNVADAVLLRRSPLLKANHPQLFASPCTCDCSLVADEV